MPLLHDGMPVSCAVFQLVGSPVAGRDGKTLNPDVAPRMRGVVEKCNFCHGRLHTARTKAAAEGRTESNPATTSPPALKAVPSQAIVFGDLADESSDVAQLSRSRMHFGFFPDSARSRRCSITRRGNGSGTWPDGFRRREH